jgi:uncharacterized protein (DUF1330 family)
VEVDPTPEQARAFAESASNPEPVFMLNLLRFKDVVEAAEETGLEAYARYAVLTQPHLERVGGEVVWAAECDEALIGPSEREWDVAAVVRYPSRAKFLEMIGDPDYQETSRIRTAALADARLIPCAESQLGPFD